MTQYGRTDEALAAMTPALREGYFAGKTVMVSGAGTGLGRAIAHWVAKLGGSLVLCGRDIAKLEDTAKALERYEADVMTYALTIRDPDAVSGLFDAAWERFGGVDILVNNAGGQFPSHAIDISPKGWNAVIDTNLNGSWHMMQAAAQRWRFASVPGSIVNIVAVVGRGMPGVAHTAAARAGVIALSKTLAIEWAPLNIRVNCVAPGLISTSGMNAYQPEAVKAMIQTNVMKRFGQAEEIADAVCMIAGDGGGFITGEVLHVDGGNQIWGDQWTIAKPDYFKIDE
ncbi:SDR family oxidoreductase [Flavisphingomonas formosensis]|uniref:SDR family oxidoreductase n=1 Tax=Flavisphingomonas formosensis TaxID=861534 RepID=UPI0012F9D93E|nr:SDR family oxidoreductase [Sphingomonas formosensis]